MKNHILFKFIAILLCAATLMGAAGSVLGVVLLSSEGLYNVTVEEMAGAQISRDSADLADWLVKNYASTELGGAPEGLVQDRYGNHWFTDKYNPDHYGYTISDAEGNEVFSFNPELRERDDLYARESFPVTGKYIHVVSLESQSDREQRQEAERTEILGPDVALTENSTVPAEGAVVQQVIFAGADGQPILDIWDDGHTVQIIEYRQETSNNWSIGRESLGFLFYGPQNNLVFHSGFDFLSHCGSLDETEVYGAYFTFPGGQVRLQQAEPVGQLYLNESGRLMFLATPTAPAEEPVPEVTEAPVPETTAATLPPETVPPTEAPTEPYTEDAAAEAAEAVVEETVASAASDIPEEITYEETVPYSETLPAETLPPETVPVETLPPETVPPETIPTETVPEITEPIVIDGKPLGEYQLNTQDYLDPETGDRVHAKFVYVPLPELTMEVYMTQDALLHANSYQALEMLRTFRNYLLPAAAICLLVFAVFFVYLCTAAGRKPGSEEVRAGGLNRLPLDLYLLAGGFAAACILAVGGELVNSILEQDFLAGCSLIIAVGFFSSLLMVGFCFAFVAQVKTPGGFLWRNTLCGHGIRLFIRFAMWLEAWLSHTALPFCRKLLKFCWLCTMRGFVWLYKATEKLLLWLRDNLTVLGKGLWQLLHRFMKLLPVTWQWMVSGLLMILFTMLAFQTRNNFLTLIYLLIPISILLYGAHCYGTLAESTRRMSKGDLNTKVDDRLMVGCFKDSASDLNALADVAVVAARNQLKSERMKTELITNVSHDIKTPLTSIINYVDLLRRPHTEAEGELYLDVLDRQSQRLKKLIEDLMDMSKANTGNMQVEITTVDAVEAVTQALGEFSDKLDRAGLTPVFRHTEEQLLMQADGRLVWRVLSNILGNAVKYAMPGTRLYVDLMELEGAAVISLKNISREELRVTAEELMARFVRGDEARNTDGSGLGLNIARSLMELQKGQLQLLVDGDLFKVTLLFPLSEE